MLKLTFLLIILYTPFILFSQSSKSVTISLAQSNNNYQLDEIFEGKWDSENFYLRPITDQLALSLTEMKTNGRFYEILLASSFRKFTDIRLDNTGRAIEGRRFEAIYSDLHLRIEHGKLWDSGFLPNIKYGLSGSFDPRISYRQFTPFSTNDFPFRLKTLEFSISVIPQIVYNINNRFKVVFKFPFEVLSNFNSRGKLLNPSLSREDQVVVKSLFKFGYLLPNFTIGAGYYISHEARK